MFKLLVPAACRPLPPPGDGPDGAVCRINLLSADEADASITVEFIDHPTF